jgi:hypothetical protein
MKVKKLTRKKTASLLIVIVLALLLVAAGIFFYIRNQNGSVNISGISELNGEITDDDLIIRVEKLIKLPNEAPEIATVSDINQLKDQSIFKDAQNGDKVLIFPSAKRAIVYRPSEDIIIEVGNLVAASASSPSASANQEETQKVSIVVLNATATAGYASRIGDQLQNKFSNMEVIDTGNAVGDYDKTLVIDVSGKNKDSVDAIAEDLNGEVGKLPKDEEIPEADILIILAQ